LLGWDGLTDIHADARYAACTVASIMERPPSTDRQAGRLTVFLCGDVMTGRGIDQALPHPSNPRIHEPFVKDAGQYVELAEAANGPVPHPVDFSYIWGAALDELARVAPDARIVNLETSITRSDGYWPEKEIHYRMHPDNVQCLRAAGIDVCVLANNHVLDFGHAGLRETLEALSRAGLGTAGAGRTLAEARAPAVVEVSGKGRLVVFGFGDDSSGIPSGWAATNDRPGIDFLPDLSEATATGIVGRVREVKRARDIVVASIHWGSNWGYQVPPAQRRFARWLLDGGVDIVHGHSSHHVRPIEIYRGKLILYGCGDFLDDYEGIAGYEEFRDDLTLMYFPTLQPETGRLESLRMTPMQIRNLKANRAAPADAEWLASTLGRISQPFGARVELTADGTLALRSE
jgi:poly-gamma-glutamate capsule biosynthesis protein CapA/YwtB (metallophosphatase superfamily)